MYKRTRKRPRRALGSKVKAKSRSIADFFLSISTRTINGARRFYGMGWFPLFLLVMVIATIVICVTIYERQHPAKQPDVATVQQQSVPLQLKPKDAALDQKRITAFFEPELILFVLIGIIPLVAFIVWSSRSPSKRRSVLLSYGGVFIVASMVLVGVNHLTDCVAFQILTDSGYVAFQKHSTVLMWVFGLIPGGLGLGIFANALTSSEPRVSDLLE